MDGVGLPDAIKTGSLGVLWLLSMSDGKHTGRPTGGSKSTVKKGRARNKASLARSHIRGSPPAQNAPPESSNRGRPAGSGGSSATRARSRACAAVGRQQQYQNKAHYDHCQQKKEVLTPYGPGKIKNRSVNAALITLFYDVWSTMTPSKKDKRAAIQETRERVGIRTQTITFSLWQTMPVTINLVTSK